MEQEQQAAHKSKSAAENANQQETQHSSTHKTHTQNSGTSKKFVAGGIGFATLVLTAVFRKTLFQPTRREDNKLQDLIKVIFS